MTNKQRAIDLLQSIAMQAVELQHSDIVWITDDVNLLIQIDSDLDTIVED